VNIQETHPARPGELSIALGEAHAALPRVLTRLVRTTDEVWPTILRGTLGIVMLPHAAQKTVGWFGGQGFSQTVQFFNTQQHLPVALAVLVIVIEQVGTLALIFGLFTRVAAAGIGAVMVGAIATGHIGNGFFMNWSGMQAGEGFEYHLLVLAIVSALILGDGGRASVDRILGGQS